MFCGHRVNQRWIVVCFGASRRNFSVLKIFVIGRLVSKTTNHADRLSTRAFRGGKRELNSHCSWALYAARRRSILYIRAFHWCSQSFSYSSSSTNSFAVRGRRFHSSTNNMNSEIYLIAAVLSGKGYAGTWATRNSALELSS